MSIKLNAKEYDEYISALSSAIINVINVLNRATFTAKSIENFIKTHENQYQTLERLLNIEKEPIRWLAMLINVGLKSGDLDI